MRLTALISLLIAVAALGCGDGKPGKEPESAGSGSGGDAAVAKAGPLVVHYYTISDG